MQVAALLRHARQTTGMSQLELALRLGVSQKHVSFVEGGRARPSRAFIENWMGEVGAATSLRNAALHGAGFAPASGDVPFGDARLESSIAALRRMLDMHSPYAGIVFDADWIIRMSNDGARWLMAQNIPPCLLGSGRGDDVDMIATITHPEGLLARMRDPWIAGGALLDQLRSEQWARPALRPRVDRYETSLIERFGSRPDTASRPASAPHLNMIFDTDAGTLSFFTIQCVFALPQDVTLASLRVEMWFPADEATRSVMLGSVPGYRVGAG